MFCKVCCNIWLVHWAMPNVFIAVVRTEGMITFDSKFMTGEVVCKVTYKRK